MWGEALATGMEAGRTTGSRTRAPHQGAAPSAPHQGAQDIFANGKGRYVGANAGSPAWELVDEGWGRKAVDFSSLSEPSNCREYVALHHRLGVDAGERLLDVACGSGLAVELARLRGARCAGIDASPRLVAIARYRNSDADIRVGDMHSLPWDDGEFDVATSFRGIWVRRQMLLSK